MKGILQNNKDRQPPKVISNEGWVVIGQDQDQVGQGFQADQSYWGKVARIRLWREILGPSELNEVALCRYSSGNELISWPPGKWKLNHTAVLVSVPSEDICRDPGPYRVLLSPEMPIATTRRLCTAIAARLPVPKSLEENEDFLQFVKSVDPACVKMESEPIIWLGASDEVTENLWLDDNERHLNFTFWNSGQPNGGTRENQATMLGNGRWVDVNSRVYSYCGLCESEVPVMVVLKGLCSVLPHDRRYTPQGHRNTKPVFRGFSASRISWDDDQWIVEHSNRTDIRLAHKPAISYEVPLGRKKWTLYTSNTDTKATLGLDGCGDQSSYITLTLTACDEESFTCDDGSCVAMERRCDFQTDCPDESDETACSIVTLPSGYKSNVPPRILSHLEAYPVLIHVNILALEIVTDKMEIVMDFEISLSWLDWRLIFNNLKEDSIINSLQIELMKSLWVPQVSFGNAKGNVHTLVDEETRGVILRQGDARRGDLTRAMEVNLFKGADNPIQLTRKHSATYICSLNLALYPFDSQECYFSFVLTSARKELLNLLGSQKDGGVLYSGSWHLMEYTIDDVTMEDGNHTEYSEKRILLRFRRRFEFAIFTFFIPSSFFVCIAYLTTFFAIENTQVRVVIALTAMLVLTTLLSQVSNQLPRNSYFKAIDMWMFTSIGLIFVILIMQTVIDVLHRREKALNSIKVIPIDKTQVVNLPCYEGLVETYPSTPQRIMRGMQIGFPIVTAILVIIYATYLSMSVH
ncbi:uncharacterized protein [Palaemon carinicauda]|uniref:uncharacterized protein n=1 Tax=Palaemon carinicauda TaxID=392227 RepID=UPI0035B6A1F2